MSSLNIWQMILLSNICMWYTVYIQCGCLGTLSMANAGFHQTLALRDYTQLLCDYSAAPNGPASPDTSRRYWETHERAWQLWECAVPLFNTCCFSWRDWHIKWCHPPLILIYCPNDWYRISSIKRAHPELIYTIFNIIYCSSIDHWQCCGLAVLTVVSFIFFTLSYFESLLSQCFI